MMPFMLVGWIVGFVMAIGFLISVLAGLILVGYHIMQYSEGLFYLWLLSVLIVRYIAANEEKIKSKWAEVSKEI